MKKVFLAILAFATALAVSPVASAQEYNFTYTNGGVSATGWLNAGASVGGGGLNVTSGGLTFESLSFSLYANPTPGSPSLYPGHALGSTGDEFKYDDVFFPAGGPGGLLDTYGLLYVDQSNGDVLNIWSSGPGTTDYALYEYDSSTKTWGSALGSGGTLSVSVPEYGALSMMILCALALAGAFLYKGRQSGLFLNA